MDKTDQRYQAYVAILADELRLAMGCTEPIAVAYACAKATELLGSVPDRVELAVSGNIIKNVKSVVVPNTDGKRGLLAAAAVGVVAADASLELACLANVTSEGHRAMEEYLARDCIEVSVATSGRVVEVDVTVHAGTHRARVHLIDAHTNIVHMSRDEEILLDTPVDAPSSVAAENPLTVEAIVDFANTVDLDDVREPLMRQVTMNCAISKAGLEENYGACIGQVLLKTYGDGDVRTRAKARAAAGSDARMSGCELPVVIVSGSGNQGITASMPVIEYAETYQVGEEKMLRALIISNLLTVHQKAGVGRLSAYCGATNAACSAAAAIAYLLGGDLEVISHTLVNALAIVSGMVCDGAKASCAAKIAAALDSGITAYEMYQSGFQFYGGDGLVKKGVENTIDSIARLARVGMHETDKEILRIMLEP